MRKIEMTCPFTGAPFEGCELDSGNIVVVHPITGEQIIMRKSGCSFIIPASCFEKHEIMNMTEAAEFLDVSKQRISQIANDGVVPVKTVNGQKMFLRSDISNYADTRKVGAPFKDAREHQNLVQHVVQTVNEELENIENNS